MNKDELRFKFYDLIHKHCKLCNIIIPGIYRLDDVIKYVVLIHDATDDFIKSTEAISSDDLVAVYIDLFKARYVFSQVFPSVYTSVSLHDHVHKIELSSETGILATIFNPNNNSHSTSQVTIPPSNNYYGNAAIKFVSSKVEIDPTFNENVIILYMWYLAGINPVKQDTSYSSWIHNVNEEKNG